MAFLLSCARRPDQLGPAEYIMAYPGSSEMRPSVARCQCRRWGSRPLVCTGQMAEVTVGQKVTVRPKVGPSLEGVVYTQDTVTNTITIKQDIPNTKTHSAILVFNRAHVEIDVVPGAVVVDDSVALPNIRWGGRCRKGRCGRAQLLPPLLSSQHSTGCCSPPHARCRRAVHHLSFCFLRWEKENSSGR